MTLEDWILLGVGLLGGFALNLVAMFVHSPLLGFLGARKEKKLRKRREAELREYRRLKGIKEGKVDKMFVYITYSTTSILLAIVSGTLAINVMINRHMSPDPIVDPLLTLGGFGAAILSLAFISGILITESRLRGFEGYEKQVKEKWGLPKE